MKEEKQMLRKLVDESLGKAIDKLKERLNPKSSPYKGVLNHSASLKKLEEDIRNGLCSEEDYTTRGNNLRNKILDIINALDEEDFNVTQSNKDNHLEEKIKMNHPDIFERTKELENILQHISDDEMYTLDAIKSDLRKKIEKWQKMLDYILSIEHRVLREKKETYAVFFREVSVYLKNTELENISNDLLLELKSNLREIIKHLEKNPDLVDTRVYNLIRQMEYTVASLAYKMCNENQHIDINFFKTINNLKNGIIQIKYSM